MSASIAARRASTSFDPALGLAVPEDCPLEFETIPGAAFGLVVHGIEWRAPDRESVRILTAALRRNLLLVFRGQASPSEAQMDEFFGAFGRLVLATEDGAAHYAGHLHGRGPASQMAMESAQYLSRSEDNSGSSMYSPGADGISELVWHNDQSHRPMRKVMSVFEALDVEPGVVPTQFRDMYTAYETLPSSLRSLLEYRLVVYYDPRRPSTAEMPRLADATHPAFTPHPHTGRRTIYVNDFADRFTGLTHAENAATMTELRAHIDANAPRMLHQWQTGDMVVWDNIGVQHRRDAVPGGQRRHMRQYGGLAE
jgi:alpha-ketoglutarate-dependent taurine dioxygenase